MRSHEHPQSCRSSTSMLCLLAMICLSAAMALVPAAPALADGVMMPVITEVGQSPPMVASPRQEAVLASDGKTVQVFLRTHFRAGPKDLAWIVPVPAKPMRVEKCDDQIFSALERLTAPKFYVVMPSGKGHSFACGCSRSESAGDASLSRSVVVESSGTAGIFEYVVLSATRADELTRWLNDNDYFGPVGAERVFQGYVNDRWHWLAMRIRPEAANRSTLAPHPITYTYRDNKLVYPLAISQLSADLKNEILLYVIGPSRYACANWTNATIDAKDVTVEVGSPSGTNYEKLFERVCAIEQGHAFVTELATSLPLQELDGESYQINHVLDPDLVKALQPGQTLTRLRAVMTPTAMDRDVALLPVPSLERVDNVYRVYAAAGRASSATALAFPLVPLTMLCAAVGLMDRPGWARAAAALCLIAGCLAVAMM